MSRYLLLRCAELYNVEVTLDPKPIPGDWNGAGGHVNFSNNDTRAPEVGWDNIQKQVEKLGKRHAVHIAAYGEGNERRLTGKHETSSMNDFSWGVANRGCSIRVGRLVPVEKCGYYEDRRPASNLDPYVVTRLLVSLRDKKKLKDSDTMCSPLEISCSLIEYRVVNFYGYITRHND